MRINKYIAQATGHSRRTADQLITSGRVTVNGQAAEPGYSVSSNDRVELDGVIISIPSDTTTIMLNKPVGYVCSRNGQGSSTIYELLPAKYQRLKPVGRLDKDSSGLLLMTDDGDLAQQLTHPSYQKTKLYQVTLTKALSANDQAHLEQGIELEDGPSKLGLEGEANSWLVTMHEGRNRQIRRTFEAIGYSVRNLHRQEFGEYQLGDLPAGKFKKT